MLLVGLTGGIGSGKSTAAERLRSHGVHLLDADLLAREVVAPGTPGLTAVVERFGPGVLDPDGALDRSALASRVFEDRTARRDLEDITHPRIRALTAERLARLPDDALVAHDVPLLVELSYAPRYHLVVVVGAPEQVRVDRLVRLRGMAEEDAWARVRAQADDRARRRVADAWLDNAGTPDDLRAQVDVLVRQRLVPYHDNVLAGRPAQAELPPGPGEDVTSRPTRVSERLRYAVPAAREARATLGAGGATEAHLVVPAVAVGEAGRLLPPAGFAEAGDGALASCDPGRPATVHLHAV